MVKASPEIRLALVSAFVTHYTDSVQNYNFLRAPHGAARKNKKEAEPFQLPTTAGPKHVPSAHFQPLPLLRGAPGSYRASHAFEYDVPFLFKFFQVRRDFLSHQSFPLVELLRNPLCSQVTSSYSSGRAAKQINLNSPKTRNSLSLEMMTALRREIKEVQYQSGNNLCFVASFVM